MVDLYIKVVNEVKNTDSRAIDYANKAYEKAIELKSFPLWFKTSSVNGDIYYNTGDYSKATTYYNRALDALDNKQDKFPPSTLAKPKSKKKEKEASAEFKAVSGNTDSEKFNLYLKLTKCYSQLNDASNELSSLGNAYEVAQKLTPADENKVNEMYVEYYVKRKEYDLAIKWQKLVMGFYDKKVKDLSWAKAYELLGDIYVMKKDIKKAEDTYLIPTRHLDKSNKSKDKDLLCLLYTKLRNIQPRKQLIKAYKSEANKYCNSASADTLNESLKLVAPPLPVTKEETQERIEQLKNKKETQKTELFEAIKKGDTKRIERINAERNFTDSLISMLQEIQKEKEDLEYESAINKYKKEKKEKEEAEKRALYIQDSTKSANDEKIQLDKDKNYERKKNIIIASSGIIALLIILYLYFSKKSKELEHTQALTKQKQLTAETEMKALRSQMNPHFIFNALQSIQHFLTRRKSKDASEYLVKFGKLMRLVLEYSRQSEVSIQQEKDALELYMELESVRLPFTFSFEFDESVNMEEDELPPLILQPFVENAIKHGLKTKKKAGHITIEGKRVKDDLIFAVTDNGIGREASKSMQDTTSSSFKKQSLGMKLTEERLNILNETKKINAHYRIIDLYDADKNPSGTRVELIIPQTS